MKAKNILLLVLVLIGASVIGIAVLKFAVGLIAFLLFSSGIILGFMTAKLIYKKGDKNES